MADEEAHWAFILKQSNKVIETGRGMVQGTAQYAELMAAFQALTALQKMGILQAILVTDSSYVATGINDNLHIWKENGYNKSKGGEICGLPGEGGSSSDSANAVKTDSDQQLMPWGDEYQTSGSPTPGLSGVPDSLSWLLQ
ncbi:hypothetical protein R3I93_011555 [Phoxinus phoxinus]|uniref:RNase H type-1 domain-containing protein n=1 Tax=Phoxinus phoxinus TaxID=58324 RepID=A0AAN9CTT5_9TELE